MIQFATRNDGPRKQALLPALLQHEKEVIIPVMKRMTTDEVWTFLTEQARTAQCATVKENGHPHVVPVWFDVDG